MALRAIPNGDEYDKDVARAIRYAVDNGAKIINGSFGKYFSSNPEWVIDAIRYASENNVLVIAAAGNESKDLDSLSNDNYPNDQFFNKDEFSDTFIKVGASSINLNENFTAYFSNYGKINVDIFAPGVDIYSSMPNNKYKSQSGTSMASPVLAGIASLIFSYFPKLSAKKVKEIILESGIDVDLKIENLAEKKHFKEYSKSGKLVNAYNALILASRSKRK
jgi:subtilisin family serine protease